MCCCCVCCTVSDLILYVVAFFLPPVGVLLRSGCCSSDFLLNILLTMLGVIPGMIHAFYYITITSPLRREETRYYYQTGWEDGHRNGPQGSNSTREQSDRVVRDQPSPVTPLLPHNDKAKSPSNAPPPYTETV
ncbi:LANO_0G11056g1_1 [Lachancea nothofagi CBS 11611]|uniref:LANO_0G11056g1_1 n=1 Tax=Lachancea nothofagi CBS 11611 TaxID=1266666 RepID=A0A1G4KJM6_9SACH|nr:LANO_0G11056g1_1 [Lachancea nothofagi CBS 11611]